MSKASKFRWVIILLLFTITATNYVDRSAISYAITAIAQQFQLDDNAVGLILGAFGIGYLVTTFVGGITVDRYGPKSTMFIAVAIWSLATLFTGAAISFTMIFIMRISLGLAEGPNFPASARAVGDWLPENERNRALSLALIAVPLSLAISGPIASVLIIHTTWRGMFFILGIAGLLWLPLWLYLFKDFPQDSKHVNAKELRHIDGDKDLEIINGVQELKNRQQIKGLWKYLFTNPTLLCNYWAFFVFGYFLFFFMNWLPKLLEQRYTMDLTQIGLFTIAPWLSAAVLMWCTGWFSDWLFKKTRNVRISRSYLIAFSQFAAAIAILPLLGNVDKYTAIIFISIAVSFSMSANCAYYAINIDMAKKRAGTALGVMEAFFAASGFLAPTITGLVAQHNNNFKSAFILLIILGLSSVIALLLFSYPNKEKRLSEL